MIIVHGFAEHLECYNELGSRLAAENILAYGHDHGKFCVPVLGVYQFRCAFSSGWPVNFGSNFGQKRRRSYHAMAIR